MTIRLLDIIEETTADGPGLRTSIYCSGCYHKCPGCHNPESWDINNGKIIDIEDILNTILADEFSDVTFSGGDPMFQVDAFTELAKKIKENSNKTIWCYTGFRYERILEDKKMSTLLKYIDVLVDGPFIQSLADKSLRFRGSSNQRIIYLNEQITDEIPGTVSIKKFK